MRDIRQALAEHTQVAVDAGFMPQQILGTFLYGSQNYGLATENSDVDTKVIIIPTLKDLCLKKAGFVKEYKYGEEKIVVMDLIHYIDNLKKQNINYVETLFTKYRIINPRHWDLWNYIAVHADEIAYYNPNKAIQSMGHQALHTLQQDSDNPKKYATAHYIAYLLTEYAAAGRGHDGRGYGDFMRPPRLLEEALRDIKCGKIDYTGIDVLKLRDKLKNLINAAPIPVDIEKQEKLDKKLLDITIEAVRQLENL